MNIEYNVPIPIKTNGKPVRFLKEYDKIFYFYHSNKREMELEVEDSNSFVKCIDDTTINRYKGKFNFVKLSDRKVLVVKKWV